MSLRQAFQEPLLTSASSSSSHLAQPPHAYANALSTDPIFPERSPLQRRQVNAPVLEANIHDREQFANVVNNYRHNQPLDPNTVNDKKTWDGADWFYALFCLWCLPCRAYENSPTQVALVQNFYGEVIADTAAVGATPSWGKSYLGKLKFEQLTERDNHFDFGNVHFAYVPAGKYAKIIMNGEPVLLNAGYHTYVASQFEHLGLTNTNAEIIQHGSTTIFNIPTGCAYVLNDTSKQGAEQIEVLNDGFHIRSSRNMKFAKVSTGRFLYPVEENILTIDNYKLSITANATISVVNVRKLIDGLGFSEDIQRRADKLIMNHAKSSFQEAVHKSSFRSQVDFALQQVQNSGEGSSGTSMEVRTNLSTSLTHGSSSSAAETASIENGIHDKVMEKMELLESLGLKCHGVDFNNLMPDDNTVSMLEHANRKAIEQKTALTASMFSARQTKIDTDARSEAIQALARAEAEAIKIRARALKEAVLETPLASQIELAKANGDALSRVSANVSFIASEVSPFRFFHNGQSAQNNQGVARVSKVEEPRGPSIS